VIGISFLTRGLQIAAQCLSNINNFHITPRKNSFKISICIDKINLNPGKYLFTAILYNNNQQEILVQHFAVRELEVTGDFIGSAPVQLQGTWNLSYS